MNEGKHTRKKHKMAEIYSALILIAVLLMSIAYAKISDIEVNIEGQMEGNNQEGVFITNIENISNVSADITNSVINYYTGTMMDSKIVLGSSSNSSITYEITVYNNTESDYVFIGAITDTTDETLYSNANITYSLSGIEEYVTTISPKSSITFTITFAYAGTDTSNNTLESKINFRFREKPILELSNEEEEYYQEDISVGYEEEYEFTVSNYNQNYINGVPMTYNFEIISDRYRDPFPLEFKIYDENGNEVTGNISMAGDGSTVDHIYTLKIIWDSSLDDLEYEGDYYTLDVYLKATPDDTTYAEYTVEKFFWVDLKVCEHVWLDERCV